MRHPLRVPLYMDRHEFTAVTAEDIAAAHLQDLAVQGQFKVQFLNYWFDEERQHAFCLAQGPTGEAAAIEIQRRVAELEPAGPSALRVRVGIAAGETVAEGGDLFGAAVQLAARLCQRAKPGTILAAGGVHDLALGKGFTFGKGARLRLKGFDDALLAFEIAWQPAKGPTQGPTMGPTAAA